jgi:5-methylcytosine-specific restriction endonuclease McrA
MKASVRSAVRDRAAHRCEYCDLPQRLVPLAPFHVEHVIPRQHGGTDDPENLALACYHCNLHKGPNLTGIDSETNEITPLFHPRRDEWNDHFSFQGTLLVGLTPVGRVTVLVLAMNSPGRLELRAELGLCKRS